MEINIFFATLATIILIIYTATKWALKGDFFHPGFIYALVNGIFFVIYAFGPYRYKFKITDIYCYSYFSIVFVFVFGNIIGEKLGKKRWTKDIQIKKLKLTSIYWLLLALVLFGQILPFVLFNTGSLLETSVENRFNAIEAAGNQSNSNPLLFLFNNLQTSFVQVGMATITAYTIFTKKNYHRVAILTCMGIFLSVLGNSRAMLFFYLNTIFVPMYLVNQSSFTNIKEKLKAKLKSFKFILIAVILAGIFVVILTNARSLTREDNFDKSLMAIETIYHAKRQPLFYQMYELLPDALINPISQLSLYAGGTFVFGSIAAEIAVDYDLNTWGTRSLNPLHRIIERTRLDGGFALWARDNYEDILNKGPGGFSFSWWGDPGNLIVDYGYYGAFLANFIIGLIIGWMYGRLNNSGPILKGVGNLIIVNATFLSPSVGPFGYFPNFINLCFLWWYLSRKSFKPKANYYLDKL